MSPATSASTLAGPSADRPPTTSPESSAGSSSASYAGSVAAAGPARSGPLVAKLLSRQTIAPAIVDLVFALRSPDRLSFRAGQFVSIGVGSDAAGTSLRRSYSIASPSDQGDRLRFIIRAISAGAASEFLLSLPLGSDVPMTGPHGFFVLDAEHAGDVVFGATGTGAAAVMPMLIELGARPLAPGRRRLLFWGVRHREDLFALAELGELCRRASCEFKAFLTAPTPGWAGGQGRITGPIVDTLPLLLAPTFYLVGNGAMIAELKAALIARGVNRKKQIRTEAFFD